ncbi:alpha/beta hydrolase [Planctobacterium marinum]|uniref:alpha/beta hydrolase n=1 Tax=Planctobacterium marinum TaxID=1631968 RepID=UPI001E62A3DC|nr:alpha/beta hydrolase-fold protein [Planctobacterium marinum]MCC2604810.1 alpha/beta hydrolase [Planctobacterium marinum]
MAFSWSAQATDNSAEPIISGYWHKVNSTIMQENRQFAVYLPRSYQQKPEKTYPVLYLLDGGVTRVRGITGMVESLGAEDLNQQIPEFIIVAIPNTNRSRDLTPTKTDLIFKGKVLDELKDNSGGADRFAHFIQQELIPHIDSTYRSNQQRGILGMSFGGLFVAHVLLTQPELFDQYLIADATFVWDDNYLNRTLTKNQNKLKDTQLSVFIGLANNAHLGELGMTNRQWGNEFIAGLNALNNPDLHIRSRYFPDEQHATVMFLAFYYGLIELFALQSK